MCLTMAIIQRGRFGFASCDLFVLVSFGILTWMVRSFFLIRKEQSVALETSIAWKHPKYSSPQNLLHFERYFSFY